MAYKDEIIDPNSLEDLQDRVIFINRVAKVVKGAHKSQEVDLAKKFGGAKKALTNYQGRALVFYGQKAMQEGGGAVINVSSVGGLATSPILGVYDVTKAALIHLTKQLAAELGRSAAQVPDEAVGAGASAEHRLADEGGNLLRSNLLDLFTRQSRQNSCRQTIHQQLLICWFISQLKI